MWFTETAADRIGPITIDGRVTEFPLPVIGAFPSAITAGADGGMWRVIVFTALSCAAAALLVGPSAARQL